MERQIEKVNINQKLASIEEHWQPRIVGAINDCHVKLVKLKGEFLWHHHENEDEMFLVVKGEFIDAAARQRSHDQRRR